MMKAVVVVFFGFGQRKIPLRHAWSPAELALARGVEATNLALRRLLMLGVMAWTLFPECVSCR